MAVLISTKVKGQTQEGYDSVLAAVEELVKVTPGFVLHCAHPAEGEWLPEFKTLFSPIADR